MIDSLPAIETDLKKAATQMCSRLKDENKNT